MTRFNLWGNGSINNSIKFDSKQKTYVITHGFRNTGGYIDENRNVIPPAGWIGDMAKAIRGKDPNANIVITDWHEQADPFPIPYYSAVKETEQVGQDIAQFLKTKNADHSKTFLIGHSLGAQVSGFAGSAYKKTIQENL